jgi:GNAT superfamily N-acetyltransferase
LEISVATPNEIPRLCELLHSLFSQECEFAPDAEVQKRGLTAVICDPDVGDVLVAREEGKIVGMLSLLYTISTALGERVALLEDMVVSSDARGRRIGTKLIEYAIGFAGKKGCKRITLLTDGDNEGAHRFYQRHGFSKSNMIPFRLRLANERDA